MDNQLIDGIGLSNPNSQQPSSPAMKPMSRPKKGLGKLVTVLLFIILLAAAVAGTYYWQHSKTNDLNAKVTLLNNQIASLNSKVASLNKSVTASKAPSTKTWTFQNIYSISYPYDWSAGEYIGDNESPGQYPIVDFLPSNAPSSYPSSLISVWLSPSNTSSSATKQFNSAYSLDASYKPTKTTINGYPAFSYTQTLTSKTIGSQTSEFYVVEDTDADFLLSFEFTSQVTGSAFGTPFNATSLTSDFTNMVQSTKFYSLKN